MVVDEAHLWAKPDRRASSPAATPEAVFAILEDKLLQTATGMVSFPDVTFIACTTDAGLLPEPLLARFPLQPHLDPYTDEEMYELALDNAASLGLEMTPEPQSSSPKPAAARQGSSTATYETRDHSHQEP